MPTRTSRLARADDGPGRTACGAASPIKALTSVANVVREHDLRGNRTRPATRNRLVGAQAPGVTASYGYYPEAGAPGSRRTG